MDSLDRLEAETITILREAYRASTKPCMLWSIGKDSTALLWMARKAFLGRVPFPMILLETFMELPEVYEFRDQLITDWRLDYFAHWPYVHNMVPQNNIYNFGRMQDVWRDK